MVEHKRPYLLNNVTLDLITVQNKAWNDTVGMLMHIQLQLKPFKQVVDNVGSHKVIEVQQAFAEAGWIVKYLPPYMTAELQPMDIAVNAVCKAYIRKYRMRQCIESIQSYRKEYDAAKKLHEANVKQLKCKLLFHPPAFTPPCPTYKDGVTAMLTLINDQNSSFNTTKFRESVHRTFQKVGLARSMDSTNDDVYYMNYTPSVSSGTVKKTSSTPSSTMVIDRVVDPEVSLIDMLFNLEIKDYVEDDEL